MNNKLIIRQAKDIDIPILREFIKKMALESEGVILDENILDNGISSVIEENDRGFYLIAEIDHKPAGCLLITFEWSDWRNGFFWWIQSVYVTPEFRRKNVFSSLYNHVKKLSRKQNVCGLRLYVHSSNDPARKTYKKCGMEELDYLLMEESTDQEMDLLSSKIQITAVKPENRPWIEKILTGNWGATQIVTRGKIHQADELPGYIAWIDNDPEGLIIYRIEKDVCEIISLNALTKRIGIGRKLVEKLYKTAVKLSLSKICLITTNDNTDAITFYQKLGFEISAFHKNAVDISRKMKSTIPEKGSHGIPIRDEIELEKIIR